MTQNTNEPLHIVGTDLLDYSFKVEQAIKQGYTFSDLNMYAPRAWPHMFEAWMLLSPKDEEGNLKAQKEEEPSVEKVATKPVETPSVQTEDDVPNTTQEIAAEPSKPATKRGRK